MTKDYTEIKLAEESFYLLPQKAIYRPNKKQLILSDIHLGKATHFRRKGIQLPPQSHLKDLDRIQYLLNTWNPKTILILGDLFHSEYNTEWLWFKSLLMQYSDINFILVEGNHDILNSNLYILPNFSKVELIEEDEFLFSHHPLKDQTKLNICGHIHPGVQINGIARQTIRLACYYKSKTHFILPAFGHLTGLQILNREDDCHYYLVTEAKVTLL